MGESNGSSSSSYIGARSSLSSLSSSDSTSSILPENHNLLVRTSVGIVSKSMTYEALDVSSPFGRSICLFSINTSRDVSLKSCICCGRRLTFILIARFGSKCRFGVYDGLERPLLLTCCSIKIAYVASDPNFHTLEAPFGLECPG